MRNSETTLKNNILSFYGIRIFLVLAVICVVCATFLQCISTAGPVSLSTQISVEGQVPPYCDVVDEDSFVDDEESFVDNEKEAIDVLGKLAIEKNSKRSQWKVIRMRVTAYCTCRRCCGNSSDGKTATMHRIKPGDVFVAADKKIPFGTEMIIPGYNQDRPVKVLDRGRLIKGNRLDVFFNNHKVAHKWGAKYLDILIKVDKHVR